jgi:ketosteroid isomerase-like protein
VLCAVVATAQRNAKQVEELASVEARWGDAIRSGDLATLEKILSDDLGYTHSNGAVVTKKNFIATFHPDVQVMEYSERKIQRFGNAAILTGPVRITGRSKLES